VCLVAAASTTTAAARTTAATATAVWAAETTVGAATTATVAATTAAAVAATATGTTAAATTVAASTSTSTTATAEAAATAWWASFHWAGFVDDNASTTKRLAVHAANGRLGFSIAAHFNKAKTFRAAGVALHHDFSAGNSAKLAKGLLQVFITHRVRQVADV
jgi:hypothetical protein